MTVETAASVLTAAAAVVSLPGTIELALLNAGGMLAGKKRSVAPLPQTKRLAVVVPAHNEELHIARTIASLLACEDDGLAFSVVVVADNCSDLTAERAAAAGARVLHRTNPIDRGKGFALAFAFDLLIREGFDQFVVVDADSTVSGDLLRKFREVFAAGASAGQCAYLVRNSADSVRTRLMTIALLAFNFLRPLSRSNLALSAGILGNGFGLTRELLTEIPYDAHSVVEDLEYHLRLVSAGHRVHFVEDAVVWGEMPAAGSGVSTQRSRWEGGRFRMLVDFAPRLARQIFGGKVQLIEPLLDLALAPLAFHSVLLLVALLSPIEAVRFYGLAAVAMMAVHILLAAIRGGAGWSVLASLAVAPFYVLWKLTMIPRIWRTSAKTANWARTERSGT